MFSSFAAQVQRTTPCSFFFMSRIFSESHETTKRRAAFACTTRLTFFIFARLPDVPFQRLGNHFFRNASHNLLADLPILNQPTSRDALTTLPAPRLHGLPA